jgi:putative tryptophan/tyrosine transport system substrate-binding protein
MRRRTVIFAGVASGLLGATGVRAQRPRRLGLMLLVPFPALTEPLIAALADSGWRIGSNLEVDIRVTAPRQSQAIDMARELIQRGADILVTVSTANAVAANQASPTVPIVMLASGYPVESGLAASLAKPGGTVTGLSIYAGSSLFGKYVELMRELVPNLRELGVFWGYAPPAFPQVETDLALGEMRAAAAAMQIGLRVWMNRNEAALQANIAAAGASSIQALFVTAGGPQSSPETIQWIADFCTKRRLPTGCDVAGAYFARGGVISYSADLAALSRRAAHYIDRILRGSKPGELPIERPARFELVVNHRFARQLKLVVPPAILTRADRVIE